MLARSNTSYPGKCVGPGIIRAHGGAVFSTQALPLIIDDSVAILPVAPYVVGQSLFPTSRLAHQHLMQFATPDLEHRGLREDRQFRIQAGSELLIV